MSGTGGDVRGEKSGTDGDVRGKMSGTGGNRWRNFFVCIQRDGLRMSHTISGQTTDYTWDISSSLPTVLQDATNTYVYGLDLISATDGGGAQTYFLYDALGSTTGLTDGNGNVTATYSYDVFGAIRSQTGTGANYWLFTGEQRDSTEALYFLRARYYDPAIGRFLSQDPIEAGHPYAYVGSNPVNYVDPSGLHCKPWHPHHCGEDLAEDAIDIGEAAVYCSAHPILCGVDVFTGSAADKALVDIMGSLAVRAARSPVAKEGGVNFIANCHSTFCEFLYKTVGRGMEHLCGITIGNTVIGPGGFEECRAHELNHVRQYRERGFVGFLQDYYGKESAKAAVECILRGTISLSCIYDSNDLEEDAGPLR